VKEALRFRRSLQLSVLREAERCFFVDEAAIEDPFAAASSTGPNEVRAISSKMEERNELLANPVVRTRSTDDVDADDVGAAELVGFDLDESFLYCVQVPAYRAVRDDDGTRGPVGLAAVRGIHRAHWLLAPRGNCRTRPAESAHENDQRHAATHHSRIAQFHRDPRGGPRGPAKLRH
jgi:hypothetical protein